MPEGDTVFRTAAVLCEALVGTTLTRCDIRVPQHATLDPAARRSMTFSVAASICSFASAPPASHSHLKMDGSWRVFPAAARRAGSQDPDLLEAGDVAAAGIDLGCWRS